MAGYGKSLPEENSSEDTRGTAEGRLALAVDDPIHRNEAWNRARRDVDVSFLELRTAWRNARLDKKLENFKQAFYVYFAETYGRPYVPRSYVPKAFDPNQPRVPAGNPDGGQWTRTGGSSRGGTGSSADDVTPSRSANEDSSDGSRGGGGLVVLASFSSDGNEPPKLPKKRPPTSAERTRLMRRVGAFLLRHTIIRRGKALLEILDQAGWLEPMVDNIQSFTDPPKTLDELQDDVLSRPGRPGYDVHHIVPKKMAEDDGFPKSMWDAPENLARIPRIKHWAINSWYRTPNDRFNGQSPRDYLRDKTWEERTEVGLEILKDMGILIDE